MKNRLLYTILFMVILLYATSAQAATKLCWTAPTTNADGTPLTDLGGYKIYIGLLAANYTLVKDVGKPALTADGVCVLISSLGIATDGTKFSSVSAYDTTANESVKSNEVNFLLDMVLPGAPSNYRAVQ